MISDLSPPSNVTTVSRRGSSYFFDEHFYENFCNVDLYVSDLSVPLQLETTTLIITTRRFVTRSEAPPITQNLISIAPPTPITSWREENSVTKLLPELLLEFWRIARGANAPFAWSAARVQPSLVARPASKSFKRRRRRTPIPKR